MNRRVPIISVTTAACAALTCCAASIAAAVPTPQQPSPAKATAPAPRPGKIAVPAEALGEWFWGTTSPLTYRDALTGDYVGQGYGGALTYIFYKNGTYKRYFFLETRLGSDYSSIFSASEGTVSFSADTFTLKPTKGNYRFSKGKDKPVRERPMEQDELERPGLTFSYKFKKEDGDKAVMLVNQKDAKDEEARIFQRSGDADKK